MPVQTATKLRLTALAGSTLLLMAAYTRIETSVTMAQSAKDLLATLNPEQTAKATFKLEDEERFNWHFIPRERKGLPFREMTASQKHLAHNLLAAGLSQRGYIKATSIMSLEDILRVVENDNGNRRNPDGYFFSIFGTPSEKGTWGYRVEGHHMATNFTISNGRVIGSPNFFGTNPAEVREGPRKGLRILGAEEDLARALLMALTPEQKKVAIIDKTAYKDIMTMASRKASIDGQPTGLSAAKMNAKQKEMLQALVAEYAYTFPDEIAEARMAQLKKAGNNLSFAWAGVEEKGGPHYYRVHAPEFLIEYDNTQNNANHVHSVWRDFANDFGVDLLKQHYQASHTK